MHLRKNTWSYVSFSALALTDKITRMMGHLLSSPFPVLPPCKSFTQVQNGFIRVKERYLNSLKISDCRAFKPIRVPKETTAG